MQSVHSPAEAEALAYERFSPSQHVALLAMLENYHTPALYEAARCRAIQLLAAVEDAACGGGGQPRTGARITHVTRLASRGVLAPAPAPVLLPTHVGKRPHCEISD